MVTRIEPAPAPAAARTAAYLAVASAYLLIVMGAVVRATGSGLGCPDWPLCHGQPIPPLAQAPIIEYSHRLLAGLTSILAVLASVLIWRSRPHPRLRVLAVAIPVILLGQVLLGAATVALELPPTIVTAHLGLALLLIGLLLYQAIMLGPVELRAVAGDRRWAIAAVALVYVQVLIGGLVRGNGASLACPEFPGCGTLVPAAEPGLIALQMLHRATALAVLVVLGTIAYRRRSRWSLAAAGLAVVQAGVGITAVLTALPWITQVLHVAGAAAVWTATVGLAASMGVGREQARIRIVEEAA